MKKSGSYRTVFFTFLVSWLLLFLPGCCYSFHIVSISQTKVNKSAWRGHKGLISSFTNSKLWLQTSNNNNNEAILSTKEEKLDDLLSKNELKKAILELKQNPDIALTKKRLTSIFDVIEYCTSQQEEDIAFNKVTTSSSSDPSVRMLAYPPLSKARMEMTEMYQILNSKGILNLFGAVSTMETNLLPAAGSKIVSPKTLEKITQMKMSSLTPKASTNNLLLAAGGILAVLEGFLSLYTGIDYSYLVGITLLLSLTDKIFLNGACYEQMLKILWPEYSKQVIRHEAGHFLMSYLMGCPVEGFVLSAFGAMKDPRFASTGISAGTSFFDPDISEQVNKVKPLTRASIDKFSVIVMGGIAAEAICYGKADGGAGDEATLVRFLSMISPLASGSVTWDAERIRNQARWGAAQAVLLLKYYKPVYDALVDALERGSTLGECIYAIEKASRDYNLGPLSSPIGIITDNGAFGEWELYNTELHRQQVYGIPLEQQQQSNNDAQEQKRISLDGSTNKAQLIDTNKNVNVVSTGINGSSNNIATSPDITNTSSEEFLKKYRVILEEKLKRLEETEENA